VSSIIWKVLKLPLKCLCCIFPAIVRYIASIASWPSPFLFAYVKLPWIENALVKTLRVNRRCRCAVFVLFCFVRSKDSACRLRVLLAFKGGSNWGGVKKSHDEAFPNLYLSPDQPLIMAWLWCGWKEREMRTWRTGWWAWMVGRTVLFKMNFREMV
jgi:hypothetical protein